MESKKSEELVSVDNFVNVGDLPHNADSSRIKIGQILIDFVFHVQ